MVRRERRVHLSHNWRLVVVCQILIHAHGIEEILRNSNHLVTTTQLELDTIRDKAADDALKSFVLALKNLLFLPNKLLSVCIRISVRGDGLSFRRV